MTTNTPHPKIAGDRLRRLLLLIFAGAATLAVLAGYGATRPETTAAPPGFSRAGGFAADDSDDQAQQQLNQQQLQQSMQQAEQQNEQAQQQFNQDMQQQQTYENQFNNP